MYDLMKKNWSKKELYLKDINSLSFLELLYNFSKFFCNY